MGDLLIRDLPARTHAELKRRARQAGMSLQAYVSRTLDAHAAAPVNTGDEQARDPVDEVIGLGDGAPVDDIDAAVYGE